MSVCTKGFIVIEGNHFEALNKAVYSFVRLCSRNNVFNKNAHPFHFLTVEMGSPECFYVRFRNERDNNDMRQIQIGVFGDTEEQSPKGVKVSFSLGSNGDSEFIMKSALTVALQEMYIYKAYYQETDFDNNFTELSLQDIQANVMFK